MRRICEPRSPEAVRNPCRSEHTDHRDHRLSHEFLNKKSRNNCHRNEADEIAACRSEQLARAAREAREYRQAGKTEQKINKIADRALLCPEHIQREINRKVRQRYRNRADRHGQRTENADHSRHHRDQNQILDFRILHDKSSLKIYTFPRRRTGYCKLRLLLAYVLLYSRLHPSGHADMHCICTLSNYILCRSNCQLL